MNKLSTIETEELRNSQQFTQQEKLIEEYYKNEKQINKNKEIRDEISGVREKLSIVKDELKGVNKDILTLNGKVSALQNQKETIEDRIQEVKDLESQSRLFDFYLNSLSKDGVSYELIEKALPMIEGEVNIITNRRVWNVQLEIDGKNINCHILYMETKDGVWKCCWYGKVY